jgi:hypothetical protein
MAALDAAARTDFDARFERAQSEGRLLLVATHCRVVRDGPLLVAGSCDAPELTSAIRWISRFAFALAAVVAGLVAIGAIPRLFTLIAMGWFVPAVAARLFLRKRRAQFGRYLLDLDTGCLVHESVDGFGLEWPTDSIVVRREVRAGESWLVAIRPGSSPIALGRGDADDIARMVVALRQQRLRVEDLESG